jgi:hypothetical protein
MNLLEHPQWPELKPYVKLDPDMQTIDGDNVRYRINLTGELPEYLRDITIPCPKCGEAIHPVRGTYVALSCPLGVRIGCSRSKVVKVAVAEVVANVLETT